MVAHALWYKQIYSYLGVTEALSGLPFDVEVRICLGGHFVVPGVAVNRTGVHDRKRACEAGHMAKPRCRGTRRQRSIVHQ